MSQFRFRGDRLAKLRKAANYTQEECAKLANVSVRQLSRLENNESEPTSPVVQKLAELFKVSSAYLIGDSDTPNPTLIEADLTDVEKRLISGLRNGKFQDALQAFTDLAKGE